MADGSGLPYDLLRAIANQIGAVEDFVSFLAVCSSWRCAVPKQEWNPRVPRLPWLMLAESSASTESSTTTRGFYNIATKKRYNLNVPDSQGRRCWGSAIGWIFTVGLDFETHLLNPLSGVRISLPPLSKFEKSLEFFETKPFDLKTLRRIFVRRACVFKRVVNEIVVMAIYGYPGYLAFARPGYESWVSVQNAICLHDVVCFKDQIFAVRFDGSLLLCEIEMEGPDPPKTTDYVSAPEFTKGWDRLSLVESEGELLMVVRVVEMKKESDTNYFTINTDDFEVYKLDFSTRKWNQLFNLGDQALFLGSNYSMSVKAADLNCKANHIYFADDNSTDWDTCRSGGGQDMCIFNMETKNFEPYYFGDDCLSYFCPPNWLIPFFS